MNVIFLDIDGVMNSEIFYRKREFKRRLNPLYWIKRFYRKIFPSKPISLKNIVYKRPSFKERYAFLKRETDIRCWSLLAKLVIDINAKIVVTSTWRGYFTIEEWNSCFSLLGLPNDICVGITDRRGTLRGEEIHRWMVDNYVHEYVILDDDSDMLPHQKKHLYLIDAYCGLTPNKCYQINKNFNW